MTVTVATMYLCEAGHAHQTELTASLCGRCSCGEPTAGSWTKCEACRKADADAREVERRIEYLALPTTTEVPSGMMWVGGQFGDDIDSLMDIYFSDDEDFDLDLVEAHPCIKSKVSTPGLVDLIEEHWSCQFDEDDGPYISKELAEAVGVLQKLAEAEAPVIYHVDTTVRLDLRAMADESSWWAE